MIELVQFEESVANSILTSGLAAYPNEAILLLRGKARKSEILINDVLIPPLATLGPTFSSFRGSMLPMDLTIMGISHSHPSGVLQPSIHDLNHFYGRIMVITAHPYQSYDNIAAFDSRGDRIRQEIIPDANHTQNDML